MATIDEVTIDDSEDGGFVIVARIGPPSFLVGITPEQWRDVAKAALTDTIQQALGPNMAARLQEILPPRASG